MTRTWMRVLTGAWAAGIVVASLAPATGVGTLNLDKVGHFVAYAGLAYLSCVSLDSWRSRFVALAAAVALGASLEYAQSFVPGRDMSVADGITNTLGVATGAALFRFREARTIAVGRAGGSEG